MRSRRKSILDVKDKVAVVTGGAQGRTCVVHEVRKRGAHFVLSDLRQEACERQAAPIGALPVAARRGPG
jgi:NAD(P)-dependent dehydrogenase (short-subunit alcohol dehydrogenase family)